MLRSRSEHGATPAEGAETDLVRLRAAAGADVGDPEQLPARARRAVRVATLVGAPLVDALDGAAAAEDDARRATRAVAVASAQTRVVAGGLLIAPVLLVPGLGRLVGADLLGFYSTPVGLGVAAVGLTLLATGGAIVAGLVRRVGRPPTGSATGPAVVAASVGLVLGWLVHPLAGFLSLVGLLVRHRRRRALPTVTPGTDEAADLTATALVGGVAPGEALRCAAVELPAHAATLHRLAIELELGLPPAPDHQDAGLERLRAVLVTSADVGAPAAPALRRLAADLRSDELARVLAAAERLPAQLTFPTALCLLPATLLLVGAPMVHAGLAAAAI